MKPQAKSAEHVESYRERQEALNRKRWEVYVTDAEKIELKAFLKRHRAMKERRGL